MKEEKDGLNWQGGSNEYYWSQSKQDSADILTGIFILIVLAGLVAGIIGLVKVIS